MIICMKNIILLIFVLLFSNYCFAQSKQIDSNSKLHVPINNTEESPDLQLTPPVVSNSDSVYRYAEEMPAPDFNLMQYFASNIHYPIDARDNGIQGRVMVQFIVKIDGTHSDYKIVSQRLGGGLEEEALHLISHMPKWKPGKMNGKPVKCYFTQPITFRVSGPR